MLAVFEGLNWQPHVEVWLVVGAVIGFGIYTARVIQPTMVRAGHAAITTGQRVWFGFGVVVLWVSTDWPLHDLAEERLYVLHMVQHLLLTFVLPPAILLATPTWLARLVLDSGKIGRWYVRVLCRPLVAGILFNIAVALTHAAVLVNASVRIGVIHYLVHFVLVVLAFAMWMPVCGPLPERRMSLPVQMVFVFLMSVLPTIPAAFLTVADNPLYRGYDHEPRLWGVNVIQDQQAAGLVMKLVGGAYLWIIITVLFARWARRNEEADKAGVVVTERDLLAWDDIDAVDFDRLGRAPQDVVPPSR